MASYYIYVIILPILTLFTLKQRPIPFINIGQSRGYELNADSGMAGP